MGKSTMTKLNLSDYTLKIIFGASKSNKLFKDLKERKDIPTDLTTLSKLIKDKLNPSKHYSIIQFLYGLSAVDGVISPSEDEFIFNVGFVFGFSPERLNSIKNQFIKSKTKTNSKSTVKKY